MHEQTLDELIAYKHDCLPHSRVKELSKLILQLDEPDALNSAIIHQFCLVNATSQHRHMTEFLIAVIEELPISKNYYTKWNIAETRYAVLPELHHIFNKVLIQLRDEDYLHAERFMHSQMTEAVILTSKEKLIYRLEG